MKYTKMKDKDVYIAVWTALQRYIEYRIGWNIYENN